LNAYPRDDDQFQDVYVSSVRAEDGGWGATRSDGWSFFVRSDSPIAPQEGMPARFYGKGIGYPVRGLFLAGVRVFYRTVDEEREHHEIQTYGADAADWLARWDEGRTVWSIEMGGLGPGYEQCIHITAAEVLRHLLAKRYDAEKWEDREQRKRDLDEIEKAAFANPTIGALGLSGAQWGAALNVATMLYIRGPRATLTDESVKDRLIQVSRTFPGAP